jgi:hypothetical protein
MRHSYATDEDDNPTDAASIGLNTEFALHTNFYIRDGHGTEVTNLFCKLGLSDLRISPSPLGLAHISNSPPRHRDHSFEGATEPSAPPKPLGTLVRDAMVTPRLQETNMGEAAVLATELTQLQPDVIKVSTRSCRSERIESSNGVLNWT